MFINEILKKTIFKHRLNLLEEKRKLYSKIVSSEDIYDYQIIQFNRIWQNAIDNIPFYIMWKEKYNLPDRIEAIEELKKFPILTKKDIQQNQNLIFSHLSDYNTISTGGSTGEPTKFPVSKEESDFSYANHYLARGWWDIKSLDEVLLFWGHSHLFGGGIKGQINQYKRVLSDWLINTTRLNAYDMSVNTLGKYYQKLKNSNPSMILGYTSTIYKIAKYIQENNLDIGLKDNLKGVVVTSETVTQYDIDLIESVFKVPCIIEYGMAETGVIAYSKEASNNIKIFWDSFIVIKDDANTLLVSTISNKLFPLINYRTDDIVDSEDKLSILTIKKIEGREKDILKVNSKNGELELSGILMIHLLKAYQGIYEIQFKQKDRLKVEISFTGDKKLNITDIASYFINNIKINHPDINENSFTFKQVQEIPKTIAGKAKWIEIGK